MKTKNGMTFLEVAAKADLIDIDGYSIRHFSLPSPDDPDECFTAGMVDEDFSRIDFQFTNHQTNMAEYYPDTDTWDIAGLPISMYVLHPVGKPKTAEFLLEDSFNESPNAPTLTAKVRACSSTVCITLLDEKGTETCTVAMDYARAEVRAVAWDYRAEEYGEDPTSTTPLCHVEQADKSKAEFEVVPL